MTGSTAPLLPRTAWLLMLFLLQAGQSFAGTNLARTRAIWSGANGELVVSNRTVLPGPIEIFDIDGRRLAVAESAPFSIALPASTLASIPCGLRLRAGAEQSLKTVSKAPAACRKAPLCRIVSPKPNSAVGANDPVKFKAAAVVKDRKARPFRYEWDFGGGVMQTENQRTRLRKTEAHFVRPDGRYRVRFAVTDARGRRCEDAVEIGVGNPPADLPDSSSLVEAVRATTPPAGGAAAGAEGALVVLPFEDWSMQNATDARTVPNVMLPYGPQANTLNAIVIEKARQPALLGPDRVSLSYGAAASPTDPAGADSINTTSQNWPAAKSLPESAIQKGDYFETWQRPAEANHEFSEYFTSYSMITAIGLLPGVPDEGYRSQRINTDQGRYMPGIADPYRANTPQAFSEYDAAQGWFSAAMLPVTDIDDQGRVNPFPLFRIRALDATDDSPKAATDAVMTASRDLHCRECHAKGGIAADPSVQWTGGGGHNHGGGTGHQPSFVEPASGSLFDQEYAALKNVGVLHDHYWGLGIVNHMEKGVEDGFQVLYDGPFGCFDCHPSPLRTLPFKDNVIAKTVTGGTPNYRSDNSSAVHQFHGLLQYNADKSGILRDDTGRFQPWDNAQGDNPNSLFPVRDAKGNPLPMEQNCLRCHGGQREQSYRDRMYTAGVTCYQCHGDMLAVSASHPKSALNADGNAYREAWLDQPDCGSCHVGSGNAKGSGYFSAGVRNLAFDAADPSATPLIPDLSNPDRSRFAVVPAGPLAVESTVQNYNGIGPILQKLEVKGPQYRLGKDRHGKLPCAACHGAAHAVWPNRDPNANDNVTARQLQGHSGHVAECGVCHTADSFAKLEDLDEGQIPPDPKTGVLGGPHNMHPVNDPYWWKSAPGDVGNRDGTTSGGWHNDVAKLPGRAGEDQCAACHGNDHKGTRLSKAAADRTFDFSGQPDSAALKAAGVKLQVSVTAGTPIGCNTCHTIKLSCQDSPAEPDCGKPSDRATAPLNQPPRFDSQPVTSAVVGAAYAYQANATDPDGDPVSYRISPKAEGLSIDPLTGRVTTPELHPDRAPNLISILETPFRFAFTVIAEDGKGGYATQAVTVAADCPGQQLWDAATRRCQPLTFASYPEVSGIVAGQTFNYQPVVKPALIQPAPSFSVTGAPPGLAVDPATGKVTWVAAADSSSQFVEFVLHAKSGPTAEAQQTVGLTVCLPPEYWNAEYGSCFTAVHISSFSAVAGLNAGQTYNYQATAIQRDGQSVTWSVTGAPAALALDSASGLLTWKTAGADAGDHSFTLTATDAAGNQESQAISLAVCAPPLHWDGTQCVGPITFLSAPPISGLDAGVAFSYQAIATHRDHQPIQFSLKDAPAGMAVGTADGLVHWEATVGGNYSFAVIASDAAGNRTEQAVGLQVCSAPTQWDGNACHGPVRITSSQPVYGLDAGQTFTYPVTAEHREGKALAFALLNPPAGATVDPNTGEVQWVTTAASTDGTFDVRASDGEGNTDVQTISLTLCQAPLHWNAEQFSCL